MQPVNEFVSNIKKQLIYIENNLKNKNIIICGDFNINLLQTTNESNNLIDLMKRCNFTQIIKSPTRIGKNSLTLIDHIYVNNLDIINETYVVEPLIADHLSPTLILRYKNKKKENTKQITFRRTKNINWEKFRNELLNFIETKLSLYCPLDDENNVNDLSKCLEDALIDTLDKNAPETKISKTNNFDKKPNNISVTKGHEESKKQIRQHETDTQTQISKYRKCRNKLAWEIKQTKKAYLYDILNKKNSKLMWKFINQYMANENNSDNTYKYTAQHMNVYYNKLAENLLESPAISTDIIIDKIHCM